MRMRLLAVCFVAMAGCGGEIGAGDPGGDESDSQETTVSASAMSAVVGANATVTASALNLRSGPSTTDSVIVVMPQGAVVSVIGSSGGWFKVTYNGHTGWCSGMYLSADAGGGGSTGGSAAVDAAIARAESGVGFSYHWGAGCWDPASTAHGACYGSCPNCSHSGSWGADCSGYVAKVWQVPGTSATTTCEHPYSTYNFFNEHTHWNDVSRSNVARGDAFVHNENGSGHIFIYDKGDAWGWLTAYEAKGCSYGIQHDSRMVTSNYKAIHRDGY
jgi:uncharacterized protein YraI